MKNPIYLILTLVLLGFACQEQGPVNPAEDSINTITSYSSLGAAAYTKTVSEDGTITFGDRIKTFAVGEAIELIMGGEQLIHEVDERPLIPAIHEGQEIYVSAYYLAPGTQLAATIGPDPVTVYTGTGLADNTAIKILPAQILTIFPQNEEEKSSGKVRIMAYEPQVSDGSKQYFGTWNNRYLAIGALTTEDLDIETLQLYNEIMAKSEDLQMEPLQSLRDQYSSSVFLPLVLERLMDLENAGEGGAPLPEEPEGGPIEELRAQMVLESPLQAYVWDDNVRARYTPDETLDNIYGVLPMGVWGTVSQRTVESYSIGEMDSPWFYFTPNEEIGVEGWVYGHFLDFSNEVGPSDL